MYHSWFGWYSTEGDTGLEQPMPMRTLGAREFVYLPVPNPYSTTHNTEVACLKETLRVRQNW